jgi:hypothetical protein
MDASLRSFDTTATRSSMVAPRLRRGVGTSAPAGLLRQWTMQSEAGCRRLVNFSDAVVAIAITLLVLPLFDSASSIGTEGLGKFFQDNETRLLAFGLSFAVIGSFWWGNIRGSKRSGRTTRS